jgi:hypothetical protein
MFSFEERYNWYTNGIFNDKKTYNFDVPNIFLLHRQNKPILIEKNKVYNEIYNNNISSYLVVTDDGYDNHGLPCFQKTRKIDGHSEFSILLKLQYGRHWVPFYNFKDNVNWENKKSEIIWRGAPTGNGDRIKFCDKNYNKYNIGLSCIFDNINQYSYLIKPEIIINEFYNYKYIISIEGNEKDSGINWKLDSNSVVIMKKPVFESWLMESKLIPWVHYVPLNDEMDNLDEVYQWCLNNDEKCRQIVKNANHFMDNFRDQELEMKLINKIEQDYFKYINLYIN